MNVINLGGKGTLLDQFISEIRDINIQKDSMRFRKNLTRIGEIMAYEISKSISFADTNITTPLGISVVPTLSDQPVIATILRAGLPLQAGFLNYFDRAEAAFLSGYRKYDKHGNFEIKMDYITAPSVDNKIVIINDTMLATGGSFEIAYQYLLNFGTPTKVHIASVIASKEGVEYLQRKLPSNLVTIWVGAIDDELTVKSYIVPGLGDAGDLAFGDKIDL